MQFEHLILLVGDNALPNYVTVKYFLEKNKSLQTVWLVCSKTSIKTSKRLEDTIEKYLEHDLNDDFGCEQVCLEDITDVKVIQANIKEVILNNISDNDRIHLNYTGGTKAMVAHSYFTLKEYEGIKDKFKSFSYLSADKHCINFDDAVTPSSGDLREIVTLEWAELWYLHNHKEILKRDKKYNTKEEDINIAYRKLNSGNKEELIKLFESNNNNSYKMQYVKEMLTLLESNPKLYDVSNIKPEGEIKGKDFFTGKWLEEYVYALINQKIKQVELPVMELILNCELKNKDKDSRGSEFELDIVLMYGYQVCVISCSASSDWGSVQKLKAMEAMHRASLMGGDEAKAIFVGLLNAKQVEELHDNLTRGLGASDKRLKILGLEHTPAEHLWDEIKEHIGI